MSAVVLPFKAVERPRSVASDADKQAEVLALLRGIEDTLDARHGRRA